MLGLIEGKFGKLAEASLLLRGLYATDCWIRALGDHTQHLYPMPPCLYGKGIIVPRAKGRQAMAQFYEQLTESLSKWIEQQHLFFVGSAPLTAEGQ